MEGLLLKAGFNFCCAQPAALFQRVGISTLTMRLLPPAARHSNLLFFASLVALLVPLCAVDIENLGRLQAVPEDIINLHSGEPRLGMSFFSHPPKLWSSRQQEHSLSSQHRGGDAQNDLGGGQRQSEIKRT